MTKELILPGGSNDHLIAKCGRLLSRVRGFESDLSEAVSSATSQLGRNLVLPEARFSEMHCRFDPKIMELHTSLHWPDGHQENYRGEFTRKILGFDGPIQDGEWLISTDARNHPEEIGVNQSSALKKIKRTSHVGLMAAVAAILNYFQGRSMSFIELNPS